MDRKVRNKVEEIPGSKRSMYGRTMVVIITVMTTIMTERTERGERGQVEKEED